MIDHTLAVPQTPKQLALKLVKKLRPSWHSAVDRTTTTRHEVQGVLRRFGLTPSLLSDAIAADPAYLKLDRTWLIVAGKDRANGTWAPPEEPLLWPTPRGPEGRTGESGGYAEPARDCHDPSWSGWRCDVCGTLVLTQEGLDLGTGRACPLSQWASKEPALGGLANGRSSRSQGSDLVEGGLTPSFEAGVASRTAARDESPGGRRPEGSLVPRQPDRQGAVLGSCQQPTEGAIAEEVEPSEIEVPKQGVLGGSREGASAPVGRAREERARLRDAVASRDYDGIERDPNYREEKGYLALRKGQRIEVLSEAHPGHEANRFGDYVYGRVAGSEERGWVPVAVLAESAGAQVLGGMGHA